jgi:hypothetical protein
MVHRSGRQQGRTLAGRRLRQATDERARDKQVAAEHDHGRRAWIPLSLVLRAILGIAPTALGRDNAVLHHAALLNAVGSALSLPSLRRLACLGAWAMMLAGAAAPPASAASQSAVETLPAPSWLSGGAAHSLPNPGDGIFTPRLSIVAIDKTDRPFTIEVVQPEPPVCRSDGCREAHRQQLRHQNFPRATPAAIAPIPARDAISSRVPGRLRSRSLLNAAN